MEEELKALFRVCNATKNDGVRCGSPALTGANFCFQHIGGNIRALTRARATTSAPSAKLKLVYPGDRQAIQHNLFLVAQALNDGKIDTATANTFIRLYRTCGQNLQQWEKGRSSYAKMRPLPDETAINNDVILSEANEPGVPATGVPVNRSSFTGWTDRSSSVGWKESGVEEPVLSEAKEPAVRVERHNQKVVIPSEEATTAPDSQTDAKEDESARRYREWKQSPQGQAYERMCSKLNPHLRSKDSDTTQPGSAAQIQVAIDVGLEALPRTHPLT